MAKKGDFKKNDRWYTAKSGLTQGDIDGLLIINENNTEIVTQGLHDGVIQALEMIGLACEGFAKRLCPVDTGRLRNSITHIVNPEDKSVSTGTNVEYAEYVENGTRDTEKHHATPAQPFLRPAANDHMSTYRAIVQKVLSSW